ncbi:MAG: hypothetical protein DRN40_05870 [Thermoplasmata archaeon]|nr:MAG: hypothetical protein DRN40_05870 [Thermoplasmata archaeon]
MPSERGSKGKKLPGAPLLPRTLFIISPFFPAGGALPGEAGGRTFFPSPGEVCEHLSPRRPLL